MMPLCLWLTVGYVFGLIEESIHKNLDACHIEFTLSNDANTCPIHDETGDCYQKYYSRSSGLHSKKHSDITINETSYECYSSHIKTTFNYLSNTIQYISKYDGNITVKHVLIRVEVLDKPLHKIELRLIGELIDNFLAPRPWWTIHEEPYEWSIKSIIKKHHTWFILHFKRVYESYEPFLRFIADISYTSINQCEKTPLIINYHECIHPGWTSVLHNTVEMKAYLPYSIYYYHEDTGNNAFMSRLHCPHKHNLWQCAYLPMTNCSLPHNAQRCIDNCRSTFNFLYNKASTDGILIDRGINDFNKYQLNETQIQLLGFPMYQYPPQFLYQSPYNVNATRKNSIFSFGPIYTFGYILRPTYYYRSKVFKLLHNFEKSAPILNSKSHHNVTRKCIVAHVRRGDRNIPGINMTEYCYNYTHGYKCISSQKDTYVDCNTDYGCQGYDSVPFGIITIEHLIKTMPLLSGPNVKNLIVMTDDPIWLSAEIQTARIKYPHIHIYTLNITNTKLAKTGLRQGDATARGILFYASILLARQCSAFIGHLGSAFSCLLLESMCYHSNNVSSICPPMYGFDHDILHIAH